MLPAKSSVQKTSQSIWVGFCLSTQCRVLRIAHKHFNIVEHWTKWNYWYKSIRKILQFKTAQYMSESWGPKWCRSGKIIGYWLIFLQCSSRKKTWVTEMRTSAGRGVGRTRPRPNADWGGDVKNGRFCGCLLWTAPEVTVSFRPTERVELKIR